MRAKNLLYFLVSVAANACAAQFKADAGSLYDAHKWTELNRLIEITGGSPLHRGALGVTFNQEPERSEELLLSVITSAPASSEAYEAYEWLSHLYLYRGQYRSLQSIMERRWAAFPHKKEVPQERAAIDGFRGLPNQTVETTGSSILSHEPDSIFIPLSMNGRAAVYFFDTGAWVSCLSESEAKRLGLKVRRSSGTLGQAAGSRVGFRTAVAQDLAIGNTHFKNVSFAVFPDRQEPWRDLPRGRRGIIGIPMLVGLQTLIWEKDGAMKVAEAPQPFDDRRANLTFDNDHLVVSAVIQNQKIGATVDTGAIDTDFYKLFADKFADLLKQQGKRDATEIRGVGHAETFDSITLPDLRIEFGGAETVLAPAHVILKPIGATCCVGNFGMDLFKQARALKIDFHAMTLQLVSQ